MVVSPGDPGRKRHRHEAADLRAIGDRPGLPDDRNAPAAVLGEVHAVRLERDDGPAGRGGELPFGAGSDDDVAVDEREVDKLDRGKCLPGIDDPADRHRAHQPHAVRPREPFENRVAGIHNKQDARYRDCRRGYKVPEGRDFGPDRRSA
jgi:hypothetical protein